MMRSCVPTTVCRRTTSDDLHHRCLSRLKNFGRWGRRGDGRHNDYLKYSSLNTTLYVGFGAHRASSHTTHSHHPWHHSQDDSTEYPSTIQKSHNGGPTTATTSHGGSSITRQGSYKRYSGVYIIVLHVYAHFDICRRVMGGCLFVPHDD
jgi:hypothetical protein